MAEGHWPDGMIDAERLYDLMGLASADPDQIGEEAYRRLLDFETTVDDAYLKGRIKRFSAKDPTTGAVVAHGYRRADVNALLQAYNARLAAAQPSQAGGTEPGAA